jgi:ATP-binding cassette, subfamily F, member 3
MPIVLQLQNAHKRYGPQELLDGASCGLADDQKVGLIGRNGAGKSTLCRILLGDEELDAGDVSRSKSCGSATCGSTIRFTKARRCSIS